MSLPRGNYDPRRVCVNPFPNLSLDKHKRAIGVYVAGALFALASWQFWDAAILSRHTPDPEVHVTFVDWVPGICSVLGFIIVNLIDKDRIKGEDSFSGEGGAVWRARLFLFIGFAFMAGGLAGSIALHVLKYYLQEFPEQFLYYGYANMSQNVCFMLSAVILWLAQSSSSEYEYNLTL
ncbi:UPF0220-domain-containing protein [Heliocybe sulcata]|uniref:UPF0220-domain-containing protein n=1 Tax=Heliocybe sulcata TaxID=5364 RepID=A0A5C3MM38_9AGAM|nr:UPF0220-domain-containing protein [Heliocybe sulcata]